MKKTTTKAPTKSSKPKASPKSRTKPNLLVELTNRKMEAQKSGENTVSFGKFKPNKPRNVNNSNVGPSWGKRKGN